MVASHGIVHRFAQSLNSVDPRVVDRLEEQLELRVLGQPLCDALCLVNDVVVQDQLDASYLARLAMQRIE